ncbi:MAG: NADP-dependent glyceraldehyde-3-phosphate dehydrogenase [Thermodesulfovibrionales bacterium]|nr:NADP-dependent glyceraldehyde-3-phosphate dehydrogenase [Thermodesulfovibrionales bacterium]
MKDIVLEDKTDDLFPDVSEIPERFCLKSPVMQREYLINGELRLWDGEMQEIRSPIYVKTTSGIIQPVIGSYPLLTEKESMEALEAAISAYDHGRGGWPSMSVYERIACVETFLAEMLSKKEEILTLFMWEIGKSLEGALQEFDRTTEYIRNTIDAVKSLDRSSSQCVREQGILGHIRRAPLGVVLCMGPYNYPLNETLSILIPALIMGNTTVIKPPKLGVLLHYPLLSAFRTSFPAGVVNIVYGEGKQIIPPILRTGKVDVLAFIGSSRVSEKLKSMHPKPHRLRSILGLEAKNPGIVLPDADIELAIKECVQGSLAFNGQRCTALKILFVHSQIAGAFLDRFAEQMDRLKCGMPWEEGIVITPLAESDRTTFLNELVKNAEKYGARIMNRSGGSFHGNFFHPTLLYPVNEKMRIYREEQFGPVVPVVPFDDIEIPVRYIIQSSYGQQASIFGKDTEIMRKLTDILVNQVCRVNINCMCQRGPDVFPFAGRKDSGEGTLSVSDALRVFSIRTMVTTTDVQENKEILAGIVRGSSSEVTSGNS